MSQTSQRKVGRAEVERVIESGAKANDKTRLEGMQSLQQLREKKARVQQGERSRLRGKYGRTHPRTQQVERNLNATIDGIAALRMDITRSKTKPEKPDVMTWVVQGHVYDRSGRPLENANVALHALATGQRLEKIDAVKTDVKGYYRIRYDASAGDIARTQDSGDAVEQAKAEGDAKAAQEKLSQQRLSAGLSINSNVSADTRRALFVRASLVNDPEVCADSTPLIPKAGGSNYRDIILQTDQPQEKEHCDALRVTRYLGNSSTRELHDLKNEQHGCRIDRIRFDHAVNFKSIAQAEKAGYDYCAYCFGKEKSKR